MFCEFLRVIQPTNLLYEAIHKDNGMLSNIMFCEFLRVASFTISLHL